MSGILRLSSRNSEQRWRALPRPVWASSTRETPGLEPRTSDNAAPPGFTTGYWIQDSFFCHSDPERSYEYWIAGGQIFGPLGSAAGTALRTRYLVDDGWIWREAVDTKTPERTRFWIARGSVYGPSDELPFIVKQ